MFKNVRFHNWLCFGAATFCDGGVGARNFIAKFRTYEAGLTGSLDNTRLSESYHLWIIEVYGKLRRFRTQSADSERRVRVCARVERLTASNQNTIGVLACSLAAEDPLSNTTTSNVQKVIMKYMSGCYQRD